MRDWIRTTLAAGVLTSSLLGAHLALAGPDAPAVAEVADKTGIAWEVAPSEVIIFLDDKKLGTAGDLKFTEAKPGKHTVKLMRGKDETEMEVNVKKGQALKFVYQFED